MLRIPRRLAPSLPRNPKRRRNLGYRRRYQHNHDADHLRVIHVRGHPFARWLVQDVRRGRRRIRARRGHHFGVHQASGRGAAGGKPCAGRDSGDRDEQRWAEQWVAVPEWQGAGGADEESLFRQWVGSGRHCICRSQFVNLFSFVVVLLPDVQMLRISRAGSAFFRRSASGVGPYAADVSGPPRRHDGPG